VPSPPPVPLANSDPPGPKSTYVPAEPRSVRLKRSMEESAGEEILYPRSLTKSRQQLDSSTPSAQASPYTTTSKFSSASESATSHSILSHKTSASVSTPRRHRKRASEDTSPQGSSVMGGFSPMSSPKDETHVRRHRSLGVSPPALPPVSQQRDLDRDRTRERRRQDGPNGIMTPTRSNSTSKDHGHRERHARRSSASSASASNGQIVELNHSRRTHDFSHLPPSPSSTALQHILKNTTVNHGGTPSPLPAQGSVGSSSAVAHSLLRGTQEGWSGLDDSATAEALRKLDGISGRSLRARSSVISVASKSSSRPGTPGSKTGHQQWEGMEPAPLTKRRSSGTLNLRDAVPLNPSGQTTVAPTPPLVPPHASDRTHGDNDMMTIKSSTTPVGVRTNGASPLKRSSESSTNTHFTTTDTPTSVSRDSTSMSTSASVSSVQTSSRRHSLTSNGRVKRSNSIGSDTSSIHSEKDRAASLAAGVETEPAMIPPVPPLPKAYQTPPGSAHQVHIHSSAGQNNFEDVDRHVGIPPIEVQSPRGHTLASGPPAGNAGQFPTSPSGSSTHLLVSGPSTASAPPLPSSPSATATRSPSKKWSFSSLNLRLPSGSSKDSSNTDPLSPRSPRKASSSSRKEATSSPAVKQQQLPPRLSSSADREQDLLSSSPATSSLLHRKSPSPRLSTSSVHASQHPFPTSYPQIVPSPTRRSTDRQSRPGSNTSHYTNATSTHGTQTKEAQPQGSPTRRPSTTRRLTPSSIPFFRRSSTHSISSPTIGTTGNASASVPATSPRSPASLMPSSPLMPVMTSSTGSLGNPATAPSLTRATPPTADITSSPGSSAHRKSVLMGLPSLLKGSNSRRSVHGGDKSDSEKKAKEEKIREKEEKLREKEKKKEDKKEEKERSESRISVLMGRRRGKVSQLVIYFPLFLLLGSNLLKRPCHPEMVVRPKQPILICHRCRCLASRPLLLNAWPI
jgi:dual specificity tyrosine-phosphorylation-regulated kinase 2/3/4